MKKSLYHYLLIGLLAMSAALASCSNNDDDGPNVKNE